MRLSSVRFTAAAVVALTLAITPLEAREVRKSSRQKETRASIAQTVRQFIVRYIIPVVNSLPTVPIPGPETTTNSLPTVPIPDYAE